MKTFLIYLAGPIAELDYDNATSWRQQVIDSLDPSIKGLSPLRGKEYLKDKGTLVGTFDEWPLSTQRGIYARDKFDCLRSDLLFVNLLGTKKVSIGTVMEISWAAQNNTPIILMREEGNIHEHPMINEACPFIVDNILDAIDLTHAILLPSSHA